MVATLRVAHLNNFEKRKRAISEWNRFVPFFTALRAAALIQVNSNEVDLSVRGKRSQAFFLHSSNAHGNQCLKGRRSGSAGESNTIVLSGLWPVRTMEEAT